MPDPIAVGRFNHATVNCRDVETSVAFYRQVLGFRRVRRPNFSFAGAWLYRDGLGMMLHLNEDDTLPAPDGELQTRKRHLAFRAEDFDAAIAKLEAHGLETVHRKLPDLGYRQVFFPDPDGNLIELGEWPNVEEIVRGQ
jgi:catechol 2,3-dioxygenase-like lactoylglutathione lyase family enzyme